MGNDRSGTRRTSNGALGDEERLQKRLSVEDVDGTPLRMPHVPQRRTDVTVEAGGRERCQERGTTRDDDRKGR